MYIYTLIYNLDWPLSNKQKMTNYEHICAGSNDNKGDQDYDVCSNLATLILKV